MEILVLHQLKAQGEIVNNLIQIILIYQILSEVILRPEDNKE